MPIPAEVEGKKLLGSIWVRKLGKHRGYRWEMTNFNEAGVKLQPLGGKGHVGRVTSMQWPMFMNLYESEGKLSMLVTVDKEGFVQSVSKENGAIAVSEAVFDTVITNAMHRCMGPWHRRSGKGTMLPESDFSIVNRGINKGTIGSICTSCRERNKAAWAKSTERKDDRVKLRINEPIIPAPLTKPKKPDVEVLLTGYEQINDPIRDQHGFLVTAPTAPLYDLVEAQRDVSPEAPIEARLVASHSMPQWRVTIIKPTEVIVSAADYLDAGVAAGDGEVIKVERL